MIHVNIVQNQKTLLAFTPIMVFVVTTPMTFAMMNVHGSVVFVLIAKRFSECVNAMG